MKKSVVILCSIIVVALGFWGISNYLNRGNFRVTQYAGSTGNQGTFYTIKDNQGHLIIIDGGWREDEAFVRQIIAENHNKVDAWIITHPHRDHAGAFDAIYSNLQGIQINTIYDNDFDYDFIEAAGEPYDDITIMEDYYSMTKNATNIVHLKRGDTVDLCGLKMSVLNAFDDVVISNVGTEKDYQNNAALLLLIESENKSMLFCSDIKGNMQNCLQPALEQITCDYVEVGHHGNWGFSEEIYSGLNPKVCFFDAPDWIMENDDYPAKALKESLQKQGIQTLDFTTAPNSVVLD